MGKVVRRKRRTRRARCKSLQVHSIFRVDLWLRPIWYQRWNKAAEPKLQPEKHPSSLEAWRQWDAGLTGSQLHWLASWLKYESHSVSFHKDMASTFPPDLIHLFQMQLHWVAAVHGLAHTQVCTSVHTQIEWDKSQGPSTGWCSLMSIQIYCSVA